MPISLKIVASLFIFGGISAVVETVILLMNNELNLNLGILGIFIGLGLLKLKPGWRICGLVFIWIGLIITPIVFFFILFAVPGPLEFNLFGQKAGYVSKVIVLPLAVALYALILWQHHILTRPDVKSLFLNLNAEQ